MSAPSRATILDAAKACVTVDRAATHGDAERTFGLIAAYWSAHLDHPVSATDVATMMALLKLARAKGNPSHQDNWIDCAGYAACAGEIAHTASQDSAGAPQAASAATDTRQPTPGVYERLARCQQGGAHDAADMASINRFLDRLGI